jgi:phosphate starvation-inducible protein PhoH and related proteins
MHRGTDYYITYSDLLLSMYIMGPRLARIVCSAAKKTVHVTPKTPLQREFVRLMQRPEPPSIIIATGPAGCGKTMLATDVGVQKLVNNTVGRLVVTRPSASVDEQHGFLPGTLDDKMKPWVQPVLDIVHTHYKPSQVDSMIKNRVIELAPLGFMRGRTFRDSWILLDEAQNTTINQMLMVLTRIGENSTLVITGDLDQHDRGYANNGLGDLIQRIRHLPNEATHMIQRVEFSTDDVVRHPVIPFILRMYKDV